MDNENCPYKLDNGLKNRWRQALSDSNAITLGQWNFVAITFQDGDVDKGTVSFYVNGKLISSASGQMQQMPEETYQKMVKIGGLTLPIGGDMHYFKGNIGEITIYHKALSSMEIQNLYLLTSAMYPNTVITEEADAH